jgi:hypothetical protein
MEPEGCNWLALAAATVCQEGARIPRMTAKPRLASLVSFLNLSLAVVPAREVRASARSIVNQPLKALTCKGPIPRSCGIPPVQSAGKLTLHFNPPGSTPPGLGSSMRTWNVPLAASIILSTLMTVAV